MKKLPIPDWQAMKMNKISAQPMTALLFAGGILNSKLGFALCAMAVFAPMFASRAIRAAFWAPARPHQGDPASKPVMSRRRLLLAYALGAVILGGSCFDLLNDTEHWPFSQYPMFSETRTGNPPFEELRLFGVTQREPLSEFPLDRNEYLEPFDNSRMPDALDYANQTHHLKVALENCLQRYDDLRASGIHQGPTLQALRLYRLTWTLNAQADNLNSPDRKELVAEVSEPVSRGRAR
jgi:hypothetical protein